LPRWLPACCCFSPSSASSSTSPYTLPVTVRVRTCRDTHRRGNLPAPGVPGKLPRRASEQAVDTARTERAHALTRAQAETFEARILAFTVARRLHLASE
jgi:hypothetical protein